MRASKRKVATVFVFSFFFIFPFILCVFYAALCVLLCSYVAFFCATLDQGEGRLNNLATFFFCRRCLFLCFWSCGKPKVCPLNLVNSKVAPKHFYACMYVIFTFSSSSNHSLVPTSVMSAFPHFKILNTFLKKSNFRF